MSVQIVFPTPYIPEDQSIGILQERASDVIVKSHGLTGIVPSGLQEPLAVLLRAMNSYYTNRIEGQHTTPNEIERAMKSDYSGDRRIAQLQRLAIAHMEVERMLEEESAGLAISDLYNPSVVQNIHRALYTRLEPDDRVTTDGAQIDPGAFRDVTVYVGIHVSPEPQEIGDQLHRWSEMYGQQRGLERSLIAAVCSHHRLAWIHPFRDGNGRVARLHMHSVLHSLGLTNGMWTPVRGFARDVHQYYARLAGADQPRWNDLDGRGNLSQKELVLWGEYVLDTCLDQIAFIERLLQLRSLRDNLGLLLRSLEARPWQIGSERSVVRIDALEPLLYSAYTGEVERARFISMIGLPQRTSRRVLASLIDYGLLTSTTPKGPVRFALPFSALSILFPRLWPEAGGL